MTGHLSCILSVIAPTQPYGGFCDAHATLESDYRDNDDYHDFCLFWH
jgi:hypothetical protein